MKKVILIGDSIRMGYAKYVKEALEGSAEVYHSADSSRFSTYLFRFLPDWKRNEGWGDDIDLVHWNVGLWDVLEINGEGPINDAATYGKNIGRIYRHIKKLFPNAKQVFATSTSVIEEGYKGDFKRHNHYIEEYNEIAQRVLSEFQVPVYDLYELTKNIPAEYRSDMTHFDTPEATKIIGDRIVSVICDILEIEAKDVNIAEFTPEKFTDWQIGY